VIKIVHVKADQHTASGKNFIAWATAASITVFEASTYVSADVFCEEIINKAVESNAEQ
jgi:hypothetical protein